MNHLVPTPGALFAEPDRHTGAPGGVPYHGQASASSATDPKAGWIVKGKASWFGGPHDKMGATSYDDSRVQGIAVYNSRTLGGWWTVQMPDGSKFIIRQTDYGPAPWTGRKVDFGAGALHALGYSENPDTLTDKEVTAVYLGDKIPDDIKMLGVPIIGKDVTGTGADTQGVKPQGWTDKAVDTVTGPITSVTDAIGKLFQGSTWILVLKVIAGMLLVGFGLYTLAKNKG